MHPQEGMQSRRSASRPPPAAGRSERRMKLYHNKEGERRIHIEDTDHYVVTGDNGVDFFPTPEQVKSLITILSKNPSTKGGEH
jgi:hypothetical protein